MVDPDQMLEFAPVAFVGTVTGGAPMGGAGGESTVFTFEVETVLAGDVPAQVDITTAGSSAACGLEAALGTRMAIFAVDEGNGVLSSGLCSTTDADLAIKALGPGTPPSEANTPGCRFGHGLRLAGRVAWRRRIGGCGCGLAGRTPSRVRCSLRQ